MRLAVACLLVAMVAGSGCVAPAQHGAHAIRTEPASLAEIPSIGFEDCLSTRVPFAAPSDDAQALLPPGLVINEPVPGTAHLQFEAQHCARVRGTGAVFEDVWTTWASVAVVPADPSWAQLPLSRYVLEAGVSHADLGADLAAVGSAAAHLEAEATAALGHAGVTWTLRLAAATYRVTFHPREATWSADAPLEWSHEWAGTDPVARVDVYARRHAHNPLHDVGTMALEGDGTFLQAVGGPQTYAGRLGLHGVARTIEPSGTFVVV